MVQDPFDPTTPPSRGPATSAATATTLALLGSAGLFLGAATEGGEDAPEVRYGRDVRPILSDRCFKCHGPDAETREAELRLDVRDSALEVVLPGAPDASELWHRVTTDRERHAMPPAMSGKRRLDERQKEILRRWIEQGAQYEEHWAFTPPERPDVPGVEDAGWCRNPIDAFVLAELEARDIRPSPEADRATLLRRTFLELTGLPPTPEVVEEFLADEEEGALERWIDRILREEPYRTRYAERMATPWMDQARYADTCGIHMDAGRQMWAWRDWVLEAYRTNMPFDRFMVEQLAGDLMPDATREQKIASGFHRNHVTTDEGGAIDEEYLVEYAVDRVATTGSVFFGLTMGCARCHDHKFDPVSQEEFYGLYAFFNSNEEPGLYSQIPDPQRALEPFIALPSEEEQAREAALEEERAELASVLGTVSPEEEAEWGAFEERLKAESGLSWHASEIVAATSAVGTPLSVKEDGSVVAGGEVPKDDEYTITLRTDGTDLRLLLLEALPDEGAGGLIGRASNGNAVIRRVTAEAVSVASPALRRSVHFTWATADHAQRDQDFAVTNLLDPDNPRVWALGGHEKPGPRRALLLAEEPFGYEGGTEVVVRIECRSRYDQHVVVRPRLTLGSIPDAGLAALPPALSRWYVAGPFAYAEEPAHAYEHAYGPESADVVAPDREQEGGWKWRYDANLVDGRPYALASSGREVSYVGRTIHAPTARAIDVSLGSDDGFVLFLNGEKVAERRVDRGVAADQDAARLELRAGANHVLYKVVNTGGPGGAYFKAKRREGEVPAELFALLLPERARSETLGDEARAAWRRAYSEPYAEAEARDAEIARELEEMRAGYALTMVMKERAEPRQTFVLTRGRYDAPDMERPVSRSLPAILGALPEDAPRDRLGLAQWMASNENPLTARVTVNRLWEQVFGRGLVETSDDFGYQGSWPSHMELLDWLAVELRESGWDVQHVLRLVLGSSTWRQSSRVRDDLADRNPDNVYLAWYPRRRLGAEQLRDQALYVSGLLVEEPGGPSVKPYQPEGLWREVAMLQSNTRTFERGEGDDLWRRSLYTYWKRACPPPAMLAFDAPTREFCTTRRLATDTPLQALVLWNDEQFVESARRLAERTLREAPDDDARLARLFRRCTSRAPGEREHERLAAALADFRARYAEDVEAALALIEVGESEIDWSLDPAELAAWTMIANAVLNLYETTTPR